MFVKNRSFGKTEVAHQNEIFKMKGREPTNYAADINDSEPHESWIGSKTTHGYLHTHHDHKTGKITHKWDRAKVKPQRVKEELDEGLLDQFADVATFRQSKQQSTDENLLEEDIDEANSPEQAKAKLEKHNAASTKYWGKYRNSLNGRNGNDPSPDIQGPRKKALRHMQAADAARKIAKEDVDEALVAKSTLAKYRAKAKTKLHAATADSAKEKPKASPEDTAAREKLRQRRLNFVYEDIDEDVEQLDELSPKTLKSYAKKAGSYTGRSSWGLAKKGEREEDKSMSTDGNKYPEKQARHQKAASKLYHKSNNRDKGIERANARLKKEDADPHIVDLIMLDDEIDAAPYIETIEDRCNVLVNDRKEELKQTLFDFTEGHSTGQLRQAADAHRYHKTNYENEAKFHRTGKKKYGADISKAAGKDRKAEQHNKARLVADRLATKMQSAGVSHSSKLGK